ncbi:MAG: M23 family metallopeptidase [Oscillospiraceae bacterium]|nr:M23 family metallopeptidase [Oscillospiraceae bacterium]
MSANEMIFPQKSFVYRSQGKHSNPASEDYGWRSTVGGCSQWFVASFDGVITALVDGYDYTPNRVILGNYYTLKMDNGCTIRLGHCLKGSFVVKKGQRVKKGDLICRMGNSGYCLNGAFHTHMTFWDANGKVVLPSQSGMKVARTAKIYESQTSMFSYESEDFSAGRYTCDVSIGKVLRVRKGPGVSYDYLKFDELTDYAQAEVLHFNDGSPADGFVNGVVFDALEVSGVWGRSPSGWLSLEYCVSGGEFPVLETPKEYIATLGPMPETAKDKTISFAAELDVPCDIKEAS